MILALTTFGGPQAHFSMFLRHMVKKRKFLSEEELIELYALCQILPGPTSTQTITSIGFKIGGPNLAYLTLLIWMFPAVIVMTLTGILISNFQQKEISLEFTKFIQPMAVGFVSYAAYLISRKVVRTKIAHVLMIVSAILSFFIRNPFIFPVLLLVSGLITALNFKEHPVEEKTGIKIKWANFLLWGGVLIVAASLGGLTKAMPILLFENFYRNGSLIFGGGHVLIPFLYTEFVDFKHYLSSEEFLSGYAIVQALPGPFFSFSAYIGSLAMRNYGILGAVAGGFVSAVGIFLPGTFLIFFITRFWEDLKKYRIVRASLDGINAASSGMIAAAALLLFQPLEIDIFNISVVIITFCLLSFTKIPFPFIILSGLLAGIIF